MLKIAMLCNYCSPMLMRCYSLMNTSSILLWMSIMYDLCLKSIVRNAVYYKGREVVISEIMPCFYVCRSFQRVR